MRGHISDFAPGTARFRRPPASSSAEKVMDDMKPQVAKLQIFINRESPIVKSHPSSRQAKTLFFGKLAQFRHDIVIT